MATASATGAVAVGKDALIDVAAAPSRSEGRRVLLQLIRKPMVVLGALVILAWVAVSVLIVTCPCALSLAAPSALIAAARGLARRGVLLGSTHLKHSLVYDRCSSTRPAP